MKQRLVDLFPVIVAVVLPVAGLVLAGARYASDEKAEASRILAATVLGGFVYLLIFTA